MRSRHRSRLAEAAGAEEEVNFWPSFADLTSTIALILFVLVLLAYIQNLFSGKQLERARTELQQTLAQLSGSQKQVSAAKNRLRLLAAELEAGQAELKLSRRRIDQQAQVIDESNRQLSEVRAQIQGIGLLRLSVLEKVQQSLEDQLDGQGAARISETGNIVLEENLLFDYKSSTIKSEGEAFLLLLAKAFREVLSDPDVRANIDVIAVQGHADDRGSDTYNRKLSADRANAVLDFMFAAEPELRERYGRYFAASAFSEFRPIATGDTPEAHQKNRRIELSVVLRDSRVREVIDSYLRQNPELPNLSPPPAGLFEEDSDAAP